MDRSWVFKLCFSNFNIMLSINLSWRSRQSVMDPDHYLEWGLCECFGEVEREWGGVKRRQGSCSSSPGVQPPAGSRGSVPGKFWKISPLNLISAIRNGKKACTKLSKNIWKKSLSNQTKVAVSTYFIMRFMKVSNMKWKYVGDYWLNFKIVIILWFSLCSGKILPWKGS